MNKKNAWSITALTEVKYKIVFDEPVSEQEAIERFWNDDYEDCFDEENLGIESIIDAT